MMTEHRSVLSDHQQTTSLPGAAYLLAARWLLFIERHGRLCWRFYSVIGLFLASAWFGLFELLPPLLHFLTLAIFAAAAFYHLRGTGMGWRWPSLAAAARRLESDNRIPHRPYEALASKPAGQPDSAIHSLWRQHQTRARAALSRLRLPRLRLNSGRRGRLRLLVPVVMTASVAASIMAGWGELDLRLARALSLPAAAARALPGGSVVLDGWITPPAYTKLPPLMLAQSEAARGIQTWGPGGIIKIPAGSLIALRVNLAEGAPVQDAPRLRAGNALLDFTASGNGGFRFDAEVPSVPELAVQLGWIDLTRWRIAVVSDQPPVIAWRAPPKIEGRDILLDYTAQDDYGVATVTAAVKLAVSAPGLPVKPRMIVLPGAAGQKDIDGKTALDLTDSSWSGMPVMLQLDAADQQGQRAQTSAVTLTLPEHIFSHPVAVILANTRRKLLADSDREWKKTLNILAGIAQRPSLYRGDAVVQLALRSAAMRMFLDRDRRSLTSVAELMWQTALRLDLGGLMAAQEALRDAQQRLEQALADHADPNMVQQLTAKLQEAMAQYMNELAQNIAREQGDIPEELLDEAGQNIAEELMRRAEEIEDLAATGAREAAQQKLQELERMLRDLAQAKPMTPEQRAEMEAYKNLKQIIDAQEQLQRDTGKAEQSAGQDTPPQEKPGQPDGDLAKRQEQLREQLGAMTEELAAMQTDLPPQLATADQNMKGAGQKLRENSLQKAGEQQGKAAQALKELAQDMKQNMKFQVMRMPSGKRGSGRPGRRRDPFAQPEPTDHVEDDGSVKVPEQQKLKRAREILDELRRRSGDYTRPQDEREYIERLLRSF